MDQEDKEYPLLSFYGDPEPIPLSAEEAQSADFETRLRSVGRFVVREVLRYHRKMAPEARVSYDPEDIFTEVWIQLKRRNDSYDHTRGNYRTFANRIIRHVFLDLACRARTVKLPADAASQFKQGDPEAVSLLSTAATDYEDVSNLLLQDRHPSPIDGLIWLEELREHNDRISELLEHCTVIECAALGGLGLWGENRKTAREVAMSIGVSPTRIRQALREARKKLGKLQKGDNG